MLNPDGVVVGNHRCSLTGYDLNRQYKGGLNKTQEGFMPEIFWTKAMLYYAKNMGVTPKLIVDYHAHSRKQNSFFYACKPLKSKLKKGVKDGEEDKNSDKNLDKNMDKNTDKITDKTADKTTDEFDQITETDLKTDQKLQETQNSLPPDNTNLHEEKELTKLMHKICPGFNFDDCSFKASKKKSRKAGTMRHVGFFEFGVPMTYTLETTYNGCDKQGSEWNGYQLGPIELQEIGKDLMVAIYELDHKVHNLEVDGKYDGGEKQGGTARPNSPI